MATARTTVPASFQAQAGQSRLRWRGEMLTVFFSAWALAGAYLDGWAHGKVVQFETFFTPWHAVFYTGFLAMALWVGWTVVRSRASNRPAAAVPVGYGLAIIGLLIFGAGTIADFLWHEVFGIEQAGERLSSPAHLVLFIGGMLVITSPLRAAWSGIRTDPPTLRELLPGLLSLALAGTAASFFFLHLWAFLGADYLGTAQLHRLLEPVAHLPQTRRALETLAQVRVFGSLIITTLLLLGPMLLAFRRWLVPFGSMTILLTTPVVWMSALTEFRYPEAIAVALATGLIADGLAKMLQSRPYRIRPLWLFAVAVPVTLWSLYFVATEWRWDLAVSPELWVGGIFFSSVAGFGLALIMAPTAGHATVEARDHT